MDCTCLEGETDDDKEEVSRGQRGQEDVGGALSHLETERQVHRQRQLRHQRRPGSGNTVNLPRRRSQDCRKIGQQKRCFFFLGIFFLSNLQM